jgi:RNA polymerase sigma factor (sigma-70 family)
MREELRGDVELLAAARGGDGRSFEGFYVRRRGLVLAFFHRRVGDPEVVADLTGETFAAALVGVLDRERDLPSEPVAWLLVIARHKLIDSLRKGRVENVARARLAMEPLNLDDEDLARIDGIASSTNLEGQLEVLLTAEQLRAIRARVLDERDYPDIAAQLECSEAVVRKRVSRALKTLRGAIEVLR